MPDEVICPIDCSHTLRERERIRQRYNADGSRKYPREADPEDPYVQALGHPEDWR